MTAIRSMSTYSCNLHHRFRGLHGMLNTAVIHANMENLGYSKLSSVSQSWFLSGFSGFLDEFEKTQLG